MCMIRRAPNNSLNQWRLERRATTESGREVDGGGSEEGRRPTILARSSPGDTRDRVGRLYKGRASPECPELLLPLLSRLLVATKHTACISNLPLMLRKQLTSTTLQGSLAVRRLPPRNALVSLPPRAPLSRISPCPRLATGPLVLSRSYAQGPPGGGAGGFPGFNMMGQQRQKGEALKEYVSFLHIRLVSDPILHFSRDRGQPTKTLANSWSMRPARSCSRGRTHCNGDGPSYRMSMAQRNGMAKGRRNETATTWPTRRDNREVKQATERCRADGVLRQSCQPPVRVFRRTGRYRDRTLLVLRAFEGLDGETIEKESVAR